MNHPMIRMESRCALLDAPLYQRPIPCNMLPIPGCPKNGLIFLWLLYCYNRKPYLATICQVIASIKAESEKETLFDSQVFEKGKEKYFIKLLARYDASSLHPADNGYYVPMPTLEAGSYFFWTVSSEDSPTLFSSPLLSAPYASCPDLAKFWKQNLTPKLSLAAIIAQKKDRSGGRILSPKMRSSMLVAMFICNEHQIRIKDTIDDPWNHDIWRSFKSAIADPSKLIQAIQNGYLDVGFNINGWGIRMFWSILDCDKPTRDDPQMMFLMDVPDPDHRPVFLFAFDPTTGKSLFTPPLGYACNHRNNSQPPQPFVGASNLFSAWWRALAPPKKFQNSSLSSAFPLDPSDPEAMAAQDYAYWSKGECILHAVIPGRRTKKQTEQGFSPTPIAINTPASSSCSHHQSEISAKSTRSSVSSRTTQISGKPASRQSKTLHRESPS